VLVGVRTKLDDVPCVGAVEGPDEAGAAAAAGENAEPDGAGGPDGAAGGERNALSGAGTRRSR